MTKKIHLFPIEPIKLRYSADWYRWWPEILTEMAFNVVMHDGERIQTTEDGKEIEHGQFLDALDTHYYKSTQLANFVKCIKQGLVSDGDIVLLLDGWNPAVTSLGYIRDVVGIKFKIALALHAGTWDEWDHLSIKGMGKWAGDIERGWLKAADSILVSTDFHKSLLNKHFGSLLHNVKVTGFPIELNELDRFMIPWDKKENQVVFPHRIAPEKQPEVFDELKRLFSERYPRTKVKWIRTLDDYQGKANFYQLLAKSKVAFSCALQETWGIVQLESWYLGATPVVPDRLSYSELYPFRWKYKNLSEAVDSIYQIITNQKSYPVFEPKRHPKDCWCSIVNELRRLQCIT